MRTILALMALCVTSCGPSQADNNEAGLLNQNTAAISSLTIRVDDLEKKNSDLVTANAGLIARISDLEASHDSLVKTFNGNVRAKNEDAVRDMTRRGVCGTEAVNYPNGGVVWRNKECTVKDLR